MSVTIFTVILQYQYILLCDFGGDNLRVYHCDVLIHDVQKRKPYRAWLPYDYYSSTIVFCLTYAHQLISLTVGSLVNVACDSLIGGLLVHICCQFEILECRLSKISNNHNTLRDCVRHHESILELVVLKISHTFH